MRGNDGRLIEVLIFLALTDLLCGVVNSSIKKASGSCLHFEIFEICGEGEVEHSCSYQ
jgi:hypothetical protein